MPHLGLICPELSGHLNPMTTLGGELKRRGHVCLIARPDARVKKKSAGLEFYRSAQPDFPARSMANTTAQLGQLGGLSAIRLRPNCCAALRLPYWRTRRGRSPPPGSTLCSWTR